MTTRPPTGINDANSLFNQLANISRASAYAATGNPAYLKNINNEERVSGCCSAPAREGFEEMGICSDCRDHCEYIALTEEV